MKIKVNCNPLSCGENFGCGPEVSLPKKKVSEKVSEKEAKKENDDEAREERTFRDIITLRYLCGTDSNVEMSPGKKVEEEVRERDDDEIGSTNEDKDIEDRSEILVDHIKEKLNCSGTSEEDLETAQGKEPEKPSEIEEKKEVDNGAGEDLDVKQDGVKEEKTVNFKEIDTNSVSDYDNSEMRLAEEKILKFVDLITLNCLSPKSKDLEDDQDIDDSKCFHCGTNKEVNVDGSEEDLKVDREEEKVEVEEIEEEIIDKDGLKWYQFCGANEKDQDVDKEIDSSKWYQYCNANEKDLECNQDLEMKVELKTEDSKWYQCCSTNMKDLDVEKVNEVEGEIGDNHGDKWYQCCSANEKDVECDEALEMKDQGEAKVTDSQKEEVLEVDEEEKKVEEEIINDDDDVKWYQCCGAKENAVVSDTELENKIEEEAKDAFDSKWCRCANLSDEYSEVDQEGKRDEEEEEEEILGENILQDVPEEENGTKTYDVCCFTIEKDLEVNKELEEEVEEAKDTKNTEDNYEEKKVEEEINDNDGIKWYHCCGASEKDLDVEKDDDGIQEVEKEKEIYSAKENDSEVDHEEKKIDEETNENDGTKWYQCCSASEKDLDVDKDDDGIQEVETEKEIYSAKENDSEVDHEEKKIDEETNENDGTSCGASEKDLDVDIDGIQEVETEKEIHSAKENDSEVDHEEKKIDEETNENDGTKWYQCCGTSEQDVVVDKEDEEIREDVPEKENDLETYDICCLTIEKDLNVEKEVVKKVEEESSEAMSSKWCQCLSANEEGLQVDHEEKIVVEEISDAVSIKDLTLQELDELGTDEMKVQLKLTRNLLEKTKEAQDLYSVKVKELEQTLTYAKLENDGIACTMESYQMELSKSKASEEKLMDEVQSFKKHYEIASTELNRVRDGKVKLDSLELDLNEKKHIILKAQLENETLLQNMHEEKENFEKKLDEKQTLIVSLRNQNDILKQSEKKYLEIISELNYQEHLSCYKFSYFF